MLAVVRQGYYRDFFGMGSGFHEDVDMKPRCSIAWRLAVRYHCCVAMLGGVFKDIYVSEYLCMNHVDNTIMRAVLPSTIYKLHCAAS